MKKLLANKSCMHGKRSRKSIFFIVIHYTGNNGDTALDNAKFFQKKQTGARNGVGAHFFVGKKGKAVKSIPMNQIAWSVGGFYSKNKGAGKYYNECTNANSVSIELCDATKGYSAEQAKAVKKLIKYIKRYCPNAKTVIRHWDVNGKDCPAPFIGNGNEKWTEFKRFITAGYKFTAVVTKDAALRNKPKLGAVNKKGTAKKGTKVKIVKLNGNWGLTDNGYWISLEKVKEI